MEAGASLRCLSLTIFLASSTETPNHMCGGARLVTGRITLLVGRLPHIAIDCPART
jgi:hypothetical protein